MVYALAVPCFQLPKDLMPLVIILVVLVIWETIAKFIYLKVKDFRNLVKLCLWTINLCNFVKAWFWCRII